MKVRVALLSGTEFHIPCHRRDKVADFKKVLAAHTGMAWYAQRLWDAHREELDNSDTLADADVRGASVLSCVYDDDQPPPLVDSSSED